MGEGKKMYRDTSNKMLAVVCSGMAEYFSMDVTLMRLLWVVVTLITGGTGVLAYIVAAIVIPEKPGAGGGDKKA